MKTREKENLQKLLLSDDLTNVLLGIQLLHTYSLDEDLWASLLYIRLVNMYDNTISQELRQLIIITN